MAFLIDQIKEQKILEMEVNVSDFLEENNISEDSVIYRLAFDKTVFTDEVEVREYLKDKFFFASDLNEDEEGFQAIVNNPKQMDIESEISVELRRGVTAFAADLMPLPTMEEIQFSEKGDVKLAHKMETFNFSEGLPHIIEIARVAEGEHPSYGHLKITKEHLLSMKNNFKSDAAGVDLAVNEDHRKNEAFGWFKDVFLSFDESVLYGQVQWNRKGVQALSEKEYRYFSPEFRFNYKHPHTGIEHGPTLLGGALTNYPFLKMEAIVELNVKQEKQTKEVKMENKTIELSVHNEQIVDLNNKLTTANTELTAKNDEIVSLNDKVTKLETEIAQGKREVANNKLFEAGKINAAQLVALNEGKSSFEVLSLNEVMTTEAKGTDEVKTETVELSSKEKQMADSLGLTPEEFKAGN